MEEKENNQEKKEKEELDGNPPAKLNLRDKIWVSLAILFIVVLFILILIYGAVLF